MFIGIFLVIFARLYLVSLLQDNAFPVYKLAEGCTIISNRCIMFPFASLRAYHQQEKGEH